MSGERPRYREAKESLARDLVDESSRTTQGTAKQPLTPREAEQRAERIMRRVDRENPR